MINYTPKHLSLSLYRKSSFSAQVTATLALVYEVKLENLFMSFFFLPAAQNDFFTIEE